jgi:hypothetical protein
MTINKVGSMYFVVLLSQQKSAWGNTLKEALQNVFS